MIEIKKHTQPSAQYLQLALLGIGVVCIIAAVGFQFFFRKPVAPTAPLSQPSAAEVTSPNQCTISFDVLDPAPTATPVCTPGLADISLLIDFSSSMVRRSGQDLTYVDRLEKSKAASINLINDVYTKYPQENLVKMGGSIFADCDSPQQTKVLTNLLPGSQKPQLIAAINALPITPVHGRETCTYQGLDLASSLLNPSLNLGARTDSNKFLIIVTDGRPYAGSDATRGPQETLAIQRAIAATNAGYRLIGVGLGTGETWSTLQPEFLKCMTGEIATYTPTGTTTPLDCQPNRTNPGIYLESPTSGDLAEVFQNIAQIVETEACLPAPTAIPTQTFTPSPTLTPSVTPSATPTATSTVTPSATPIDPTATPTSTFTPTPSNTPTNTPSATPSNTPSSTPTRTPTNTATPTATNTLAFSPTPTNTLAPGVTPSVTPTPSNTPTSIPGATATPVPTNTLASTGKPELPKSGQTGNTSLIFAAAAAAVILGAIGVLLLL